MPALLETMRDPEVLRFTRTPDPMPEGWIDKHEDYEVKYWTHEFGVTREQLRIAVEKVGNSAAAVRKQLKA